MRAFYYNNFNQLSVNEFQSMNIKFIYIHKNRD